MSIFSRKPKCTTEEFCQSFYDDSLSIPSLDLDAWGAWCKKNRDAIGLKDLSFRAVDLPKFSAELRALHLEVVGIAWVHHANSEFTVLQAEFTKLFLERRNEHELWELGEDYNQAVARAQDASFRNDPNPTRGEASHKQLNKEKLKFFGDWTSKGYDGKIVSRAANRLGSKQAWRDQGTLIYLSFVLTKHLGCELNDEGRQALMALIFGFYNGAKEAIQSVRIVA
jgi:hypothetical protein